MGGSFLSEAFAPFVEILTSAPVIASFERWLFVVCLAFVVFGFFAIIDTLSFRRYFFTSAYVSILTGPLGTFCAMVFIEWPLISEVLQWV